ncbi:MAG: ATP-binding protein [Gemmatales bacterium]
MSKLIAFAGLPGTGKTTLAKRLAEQLGAVLLNKDDLRASLFAPGEIDYTSTQNDFCMAILYQLAVYHAEHHPERAIIIDGRTFSRRAQVSALEQCAEQCARPLALIECVCSVAVVEERLTHDAGKHVAADRNVELFHHVKASWEEITIPKLTLSTDEENEEQLLKRILKYLGQ